MIDLAQISGLPIKFDEESEKMEDIGYEAEYRVPLNHISPILLNKYLRYPEYVYTHYKNLSEEGSGKKNASYDLIYMPYGLLGIEFVKSHIYYSDPIKGKYDSLIEVLYGNLTVMIQKNREKEDPFEFETWVDEINIITLRVGEKLAIPTGVYYTFINTGAVPVIFSIITSNNHHVIDYGQLRRERGLAYFLISKNAKIEIVANPKYKIACKLRCASLRRLMTDQTSPYIKKEVYSTKHPLYQMFVQDVFAEVFGL